MIFSSSYHCIEIRKDTFRKVEAIIKDNYELVAIENLKEFLKDEVFTKNEDILFKLAKHLYEDYLNGKLAKYKVGFFGI